MSYKCTGRTTVHAIGKCPIKGCKTVRRIVCPDMRIMRDRIYTYTEILIPAPGWADVIHGDFISPYTDPFTDSPKGDEAQAHRYSFIRHRLAAMTTAGLICVEHNRYLKVTPVKGVVNASKACDGRCMGATGPNCECSCGGANHGASWSL